MKSIFDPITIGNLPVKNRIVRSATFEMGGAENGKITPLLKEFYEKLAQGDIGVLITGMMGVGPNACLNSHMVKVYDDSFVNRVKDAIQTTQSYGTKVIVQIAHAGIKAMDIDKGEHPLGPSEMTSPPAKPALAMTKQDIQNLVSSFADSAFKCKEAGADGVQIHGAHGYLLSQFLSPYYNKRMDEYGGSIENRARVYFEIYDAIRTKAGVDFPIWIKINTTDLIDDGLTEQESVWVCKELEKRGIDAIELSAGIGLNSQTSPAQRMTPNTPEGFFAEAAIRLADQIETPIISTGGYRTQESIENYLNKGNIAAIGLSRPLISEPNLVKRWKDGNNAKARCISCSKCFRGEKYGCPVFA